MELAARWCTFLEAHSRRLYAYRGGAARSTTALASKLQKRELPNPFKARDVQRKGWQSLADLPVIEKALDELVTSGWLREVTSTGGSGKGRPPATSYTINPRIHSAT